MKLKNEKKSLLFPGNKPKKYVLSYYNKMVYFKYTENTKMDRSIVII